MFGVLVLAAVAISASPRRIEPTAAKLVGAGLLSGVMGKRYSLEQANEALADVEALKVTKAIIAPD
jgi:hypothetical protein